jgi:TetR/AcrR family fatty acid metabolism transcriptional regulator
MAEPRGEGTRVRLELDDPMASLPPVAANILQAARRLLDRGGFEALRLQAIAEEAGEAKGSIAYYFGNKRGLVAALVDCLAHDANRALIDVTKGLPAGEERLHALVDHEARISADIASFRAFFEILPHVLRDEDLRARVARLYDGYRETVRRAMGADGAGMGAARDRPSYAMLVIALVDGLAIQHSLDPGWVDIGAASDLWERLLRAALGAPTQSGAGDEPGTPGAAADDQDRTRAAESIDDGAASATSGAEGVGPETA